MEASSSAQWIYEPENDELPFNCQPDQMSSLQQFTSMQILEPVEEEIFQQYPLTMENYSTDYPPFNSQDIPKFSNISCPSTDVSFVRPEANLSYLSFCHPDSLHDPTQANLTSSVGYVDTRNDDHIESLLSHGSTWNNNILDFQRPEKKSIGSRTPYSAQEHVIAERKRREKLNQQFITLSSVIPDVKKIDKASLLAGAINYVKQLEEKVKTLEEKVAERTMETTILVQNSNDISKEEVSASNIEGKLSVEDLPKIEVSRNGNTILVRVQCEKRKGVLVKILSEIEKFHFSVINTSVIPFAPSMNIAVTAQIEEGFSTSTVRDLVKEIDLTLTRCI